MNIKLLASTLNWMRYKGRKWQQSENGKWYSVQYTKAIEKEWLDCIPERYRFEVLREAFYM